MRVQPGLEFVPVEVVRVRHWPALTPVAMVVIAEDLEELEVK